MINTDANVIVMPYNTRRKLPSLPSLAIQLPISHASRATPRPPLSSGATIDMETPLKKLKRSHKPSLPSTGHIFKRAPNKYDNTPPPSPKADSDEKDDNWLRPKFIDFDGIKDEIVEAVITQLLKTGNRPHLVKELAVILSSSVKVVEQSANPSAIVSSRLSSFIRRPWSSVAPCPIAKQLETVHPRRTHYYLKNYPHLHISNFSNRDSAARAIISPSISNATSRSDEADNDRRREISPSPEIDFLSPEYDEENHDYSSRPTLCRFPCQVKQITRINRSTSPPLEKDEKEFTQTARGMQKRKFGDTFSNYIPPEIEDYPIKSPEYDLLFGKQMNHSHNLVLPSSPIFKSGTLRRSIDELNDLWPRPDNDWDLRSPENVELDELDGMFDNL